MVSTIFQLKAIISEKEETDIRRQLVIVALFIFLWMCQHSKSSSLCPRSFWVHLRSHVRVDPPAFLGACVLEGEIGQGKMTVTETEEIRGRKEREKVS